MQCVEHGRQHLVFVSQQFRQRFLEGNRNVQAVTKYSLWHDDIGWLVFYEETLIQDESFKKGFDDLLREYEDTVPVCQKCFFDYLEMFSIEVKKVSIKPK